MCVCMCVCRCFGEDVCISVPDIDAVVMVMQPSEPRITIMGAEHLSIPAPDLALGLSLFRDLHISSTVMKNDQTSHSTGTDQNHVKMFAPSW